MTTGEEMFLKAKGRTFVGLTEGSQVNVNINVSFTQVTVGF